MRSKLLKLVLAGALAFSFANAADEKTIVVGATPIPHAEILKLIKPEFKFRKKL